MDLGESIDFILEDFVLSQSFKATTDSGKLISEICSDDLTDLNRVLRLLKLASTEERLEWAVIAKLTILLQNKAMKLCIDASTQLSLSLSYWNGLLRSRFRFYQHGIQLLPFYGYKAYQSRNLPEFIKKISNPFEGYLALRVDIRNKREHCLNTINQLASFIGLMNEQTLPKSLTKGKLIQFVSNMLSFIDQALYFLSREPSITTNLLFSPQAAAPIHRIASDEILNSIFPVKSDKSLGKFDAIELITDIVGRINASQMDWQERNKFVLTPSPLVRHWPRALLYAISAYTAIRLISSNINSLSDCCEYLLETTKQFLISWVRDPLSYVWKTIRQEETLKLTSGAAALTSDLNSLERMVIEYAKENGTFGDSQLQEISQSVKEGDISVVMKSYENGIKSPVKSLIIGDLIRIILIQVQKAKVDLEMAMQALDSIIRSQQLNFAFLAVAPALIVSGALIRFMWNSYSSVTDVNRQLSSFKFQNGLRYHPSTIKFPYDFREIERTLIQHYDAPNVPYKSNGYIIIQIHLLELYIQKINRNDRTMFILEDLVELKSNNLTTKQKILIVNRMKNYNK